MCTSQNQKWGRIVPSLAVSYGLCSPGQVIVHPQRWKIMWKLHRLSGQRLWEPKRRWKCSFSPAEMFPYLQDNVQGSAWIKQSSEGECWVGKAPGCAHTSWKAARNVKTPNSWSGELWSKFFQKKTKRIVCISLNQVLLLHQSKQVFHLLFLVVLMFQQLGLPEWMKPSVLSPSSRFCTCCKVLFTLPPSQEAQGVEEDKTQVYENVQVLLCYSHKAAASSMAHWDYLASPDLLTPLTSVIIYFELAVTKMLYFIKPSSVA